MTGAHELPQASSPLTGGVFSLNLSGELRSAERGDSPRPAAGQEGRHQGFYPLNSHFLLFLSLAQTRDRRPLQNGERQSGYRSVSFSAFSQFTDSLLLHIRLNPRKRNIPVLRNSLTRYTARHLRIRHLVQFIFVGAVYHNALSNCAALLSPRGPSLALRAIHLVPRLRRVNHLCSSNLSVNCEYFTK